MSVLEAAGLSRNVTAAGPFDHYISLVDSTQADSDPSRDASPGRNDPNSPRTTGQNTPSTPISRHWTLREEWTKRKYSKWRESKFAHAESTEGEEQEAAGEGNDTTGGDVAAVNTQTEDFAPGATGSSVNAMQQATAEAAQRGRTKTTRKKAKQSVEIDILYENQRGSFFCGIPLFSHNSLLNFDPSAWETASFHPSPVDITNAQPPDPSWEWAWKSWYVDMSADVDEEGWQYSFSFSPTFSWHGTHVWFHSFVRRRRWLRKRQKRRLPFLPPAQSRGDAKMREGHMMNADYFTIHPQLRDHSPSSSFDTAALARLSRTVQKPEQDDDRDIRNIGMLLAALKKAKIDREKIDAIDTFIHRGGDEVYYLTEKMEEIMSFFLFQASRRQLLAHLSKHYASNEGEETSGDEEERDRRKRSLHDAIRAAEEQVKRLEYWSDVRQITTQGETVGAVDRDKGWDASWTGLDASGPAYANDGEKGKGRGDS